MSRLILSPAGNLMHPDGSPCEAREVEAGKVDVAHLVPQVMTYTLPQGDAVKVLVTWSCHCWTSSEDQNHPPEMVRILDGTRKRVIDLARLEASVELPALIAALPQHRIYVTPSDRNYGAYNASLMAPDGLAYTVFFILKQDRGRFDGIRHALRLVVESAYPTVQPQVTGKTTFASVIGAALKGGKIKYRR